jgi:hypothetical protein
MPSGAVHPIITGRRPGDLSFAAGNATTKNLDYRVSPLRGGPAMTEKNRKVMRDETNESRFP